MFAVFTSSICPVISVTYYNIICYLIDYSLPLIPPTQLHDLYLITGVLGWDVGVNRRSSVYLIADVVGWGKQKTHSVYLITDVGWGEQKTHSVYLTNDVVGWGEQKTRSVYLISDVVGWDVGVNRRSSVYLMLLNPRRTVSPMHYSGPQSGCIMFGEFVF